MKQHYKTRGVKNARMHEAIQDSLKHGNYFFTKDTIEFWRSEVEYGMFSNNTFVTSEDNYDRSRKLFTARLYDWENHSVETIGKFQQFDNLDDAIAFAKSYTGDEEEVKEKTIKVLKVEPDKAPEVIEIPNTLEAKQEIVGGYIEVLPIEEGVAIVCNEEGKLDGLELNRPIYQDGKIVEIIAGTFFIAGDDISIGEFVSLTDEQIEKYTAQFLKPVVFIKVGKEIVAVPRY